MLCQIVGSNIGKVFLVFAVTEAGRFQVDTDDLLNAIVAQQYRQAGSGKVGCATGDKDFHSAIFT